MTVTCLVIMAVVSPSGGRYTGTDNPDTTATAVVAKAGYKFNEHFRYGAFVDQNCEF